MLTNNRMLTHAHPWKMLKELQASLNDEVVELFAQTEPQRYHDGSVNIASNDDEAIVTMEMPGLELDDFDVSVHKDQLTIAVSRKADVMIDEGEYRLRERNFGRLSRTVQLPFAISSQLVSATYADGLLEVTIQQPEATKPTTIAVTAG